MRKSSVLFVLIFLVGILTSCVGKTPTLPPTSDADRIATIVAATLTAIPSSTPTPEPTATLTPEPPSLLPRSLYYQAGDPNGKAQVYRLSRDGTTITQVTSEAEGVNYFDVSPVDGRIVYSIGNQLVLADNNGANRQVIVTNQKSSIYGTHPRWSPDGQTIAYVDNDSVYFYSLETGVSKLMLGNDGDSKYVSIGDFSPDGSKLIVRRALYDRGVYDIPSQTVAFLRLSEFPKMAFGCSPTSWSPDSKYLYVAEWVNAGGADCYRQPGLWRFNPDGTGTTLLPGIGNNGVVEDNKTAAPWQDTNGDLVYLFSPPETVYDPNAPFSLVRSESDGIMDRVVLRSETFHGPDTTLWTPDGSALVIIQIDGTNSSFINTILVPVDPSLPIVTLPVQGSSLRWGP